MDIAIIDLGTNTFNLLICRKEKDKFKVKVCREKSVKLIVIEAEEFGGDIEDQINKALDYSDCGSHYAV